MMVFDVEHLEQSVTLMRLQGRLDAAAAPGLLARLTGAIAEGKTQFVVDLAEVPFIDSTGLGALVSGLKAARRVEGDLRLAAPGPQVRKLLRLTTLDRVFTILETI
ncbi:STAS domain-containing protein [Microvirga sp. CF3016]|uniref:STAS domain-containing protein n=1 Tax=Microvirga sp. CF3016 TaxID=3110181 RepID=UPI002E79E094|nr:STAS domain-containing protein [Microvirga sp. CF3016]MEE1612152.1 STAS domain-containing protein [Microvirga sp. CF3016]